MLAVKRLYLTHLDNQTEKEYLKVLSLMNGVRYRHTAIFYGACTEDKKYVLISDGIYGGGVIVQDIV